MVYYLLIFIVQKLWTNPNTINWPFLPSKFKAIDCWKQPKSVCWNKNNETMWNSHWPRHDQLGSIWQRSKRKETSTSPAFFAFLAIRENRTWANRPLILNFMIFHLDFHVHILRKCRLNVSCIQCDFKAGKCASCITLVIRPVSRDTLIPSFQATRLAACNPGTFVSRIASLAGNSEGYHRPTRPTYRCWHDDEAW